MRIFLPVAIAILNAVEFVGRVIVGDLTFIKLAVVELFTYDGTNRKEASRLGSCSSLGGGRGHPSSPLELHYYYSRLFYYYYFGRGLSIIIIIIIIIILIKVE